MLLYLFCYFISVTEQMRQMGEYKFNLTEGSLASCLNQLTSSDGVRYLGLSLAIPQNIGQLNSMAFNVSMDNGERYKPKSFLLYSQMPVLLTNLFKTNFIDCCDGIMVIILEIVFQSMLQYIHRAHKAHYRNDCLTPIPLSVRYMMPFKSPVSQYFILK